MREKATGKLSRGAWACVDGEMVDGATGQRVDLCRPLGTTLAALTRSHLSDGRWMGGLQPAWDAAVEVAVEVPGVRFFGVLTVLWMTACVACCLAWGARRRERQAVGVGLLQDPWLAGSDRAQPLCRAFQLQIHAAQFLVAGRLCRGCFNRFPAARCIGACLPARHGGALG